MSSNGIAEQPPNNGFYVGCTYNPTFFSSQTSNSGGASEQWVEENFLEKTGNPTDEAQTTTFEGQLICKNTTSSSQNDGAIVCIGGVSCSDVYVTDGTINGPYGYLFPGAEGVQIGNQNNATVSVALLQVNNTGYGINNNGPLYCGGNITTPQDIQGYYVTATQALVSENLYESVTGTGTGNPTVYCASPNVSIATQASTINLGTQTGSTPQTINIGNSTYNATTLDLNGNANISTFMNLGQYLNILGSININQAVSVFSGGTNYKSGQVYISQPFQGQSFKVVMIVANNLATTGTLNYTYNYPTPFISIVTMFTPVFNLYPSGSSPDGLTMSASSTLTQLTYSVLATSTNNGVILLVGR
jgi:hypothetical protein